MNYDSIDIRNTLLQHDHELTRNRHNQLISLLYEKTEFLFHSMLMVSKTSINE